MIFRCQYFLFGLFFFAFFSEVRSEKTDEKHLVWSIEIEGNRKVSTSQLFQAMKNKEPSFLAKNLRIGTQSRFKAFYETTLEKDLQRILSAYRYFGFYNAKILPQKVGKRSQLYRIRVVAPQVPYQDFVRIQIKIRVQEGPQVKVKGIEFPNHEKWKFLFKTEDLLVLSSLYPKSNFSTPLYQAFKSEIVKRFLQIGYAIAKVEGRVLVDKNSSLAIVQMSIKTGPPCVFGKLSIEFQEQNELVLLRRTYSPLFKKWGISFPESPLSQYIRKTLPTMQKAIQSQKWNLAFQQWVRVFFSIQSTVTRREELLFYVKKFIQFKRGEQYKIGKLLASRKALLSLGLFESVNFRPLFKDLKDSKGSSYEIPMTLGLKEDKFHHFQIGFGFSKDPIQEKAEINFNYTLLHFLGGLRKLAFEIQPGLALRPGSSYCLQVGFENCSRIETNFSVVFTQPLFLGKRKADFEVRFFYNFLVALNDVNFHLARPSVSFSLPINSILFSKTSLNFEIALNVFDPLSAVPISYNLGYVEQIFSVDKRDDFLNPKKGFYASLAVQGGGFDFLFLRTEAKFQGFVSFLRYFQILGRFRYGVLFSKRMNPKDFSYLPTEESRNIADILSRSPWTKRLFSGGPNTVRGWSDRFLGPLACQVVSQQKTQKTSISDTSQGSTQRIFEERETVRKNISGVQKRDDGTRCHREAGNVVLSQFDELANQFKVLPTNGVNGTYSEPTNPKLQLTPMGGEHLLEGSLELRINFLWLISKSKKQGSGMLWLAKNLSIFFFVDAGLVHMEPSLQEDYRPAISFGGGLLVSTPIGKVSFDLTFYRLFDSFEKYPLQQLSFSSLNWFSISIRN